jgi:thymidine phosphorylase
VSLGAGIALHAKPGQEIQAGQPLLTMFTDEEGRFEVAQQALDEAPITIGSPEQRKQHLPLIIERIS